MLGATGSRLRLRARRHEVPTALQRPWNPRSTSTRQGRHQPRASLPPRMPTHLRSDRLTGSSPTQQTDRTARRPVRDGEIRCGPVPGGPGWRCPGGVGRRAGCRRGDPSRLPGQECGRERTRLLLRRSPRFPRYGGRRVDLGTQSTFRNRPPWVGCPVRRFLPLLGLPVERAVPRQRLQQHA